MPNSDTWPRTVSVETLSNMDSARSFDSVISVNSACSEDSMEHLSAEEKACLMYLEETIESLDLQEDSGFSNDEPDPAIWRLKHSSTEASPQSDICINILTALVESGGPSAANESDPPSQSLHTSSSTLDISDPDLPSHIPPDPTLGVPEATFGRTTPVPAQDTIHPGVPTDRDLTAKMDLSVIPPPSDFMDKPDSLVSSPSPKPSINLEVLRRRMMERSVPASASEARPAPLNSTPVSPAPMDLTIVSPVLLDKPAPTTEVPPSSPPTAAPSEEPKSPPAIAPKPKKLPPNIILKSHKSTGAHDNLMGHPSSGDRPLMDPQKVRMEALRKLGLLKGDEGDLGHAVSPKAPQTRRSWAPSSSPLSPPPLKSTPPPAPCTTSVHTTVPSPQTSIPPHVPSEPLPDIIPVPAAFSDPVVRSHDDVFVAISDQGSPALDKKLLLSSSGGGGLKSATLERSGLGLSSYMESMDKQQQQNLGQLRNSRPRPASLGSGKDFVPAHSSPSVSSQKLPRSQGISVIFSPGEQSEGARREALKKLGLLRY